MYGEGVLETVKSVGNVAGHVKFNSALGIAPLKTYATEEITVPVHYRVVTFLEVEDEVVYVLVVDILNTEVIDNKVEGDGIGEVFEETKGETNWDITTGGKVSDEFFVCNAACLWETVHPFL